MAFKRFIEELVKREDFYTGYYLNRVEFQSLRSIYYLQYHILIQKT